MGSPVPKQFLDIGGRPIYAAALTPFLANCAIARIRIGVPDAHLAEIREEVGRFWPDEARSGRLGVFAGGPRRQDTVERGVRLLDSEPDPVEGILVHDAARPFLSPDILDRTLCLLDEGHAVGVAVPVADTLWKVVPGEESLRVCEIVSRDGLYAAQTPQGAPRRIFLDALDRARDAGREFTDEASLFLWAGFPFILVEGSNKNRKITRPEDLHP